MYEGMVLRCFFNSLPYNFPIPSISAAAQSSSGREAERPFKAYPRVPVTLPTNSFYGPFTPPTFVGSVNIPASHTSASLKRLEESSHHHHSRHHSSSSSMDPMSPHQYNSLMQVHLKGRSLMIWGGGRKIGNEFIFSSQRHFLNFCPVEGPFKFISCLLWVPLGHKIQFRPSIFFPQFPLHPGH